MHMRSSIVVTIAKVKYLVKHSLRSVQARPSLSTTVCGTSSRSEAMIRAVALFATAAALPLSPTGGTHAQSR
jgi:hypothetical protein